VANYYSRKEYQDNRAAILASVHHCQMVPGCLNKPTTADHIIPLSAGGSNHIDNLRAACAQHNFGGGAAIVNERRRARRIGRRSRNW
jgi:5-methylcytosine-specific restriction endonuclease McrA